MYTERQVQRAPISPSAAVWPELTAFSSNVRCLEPHLPSSSTSPELVIARDDRMQGVRAEHGAGVAGAVDRLIAARASLAVHDQRRASLIFSQAPSLLPPAFCPPPLPSTSGLPPQLSLSIHI